MHFFVSTDPLKIAHQFTVYVFSLQQSTHIYGNISEYAVTVVH